MRKSSSLLILCFACIYLIWGSTYLAIKLAIEEMPPLFMAGSRFLCAGLFLFVIGKLRSEPPLSAKDRWVAFFSGLPLVLANALVCLGEQYISSGTTAVLIGSVPIWIILLDVFLFDGKTPKKRALLGIAISIAGVILLSRSQLESTDSSVLIPGAEKTGVILIFASVIFWSFGTLFQRKAGNVRNVFSFSAFQLTTGSSIAWLLALFFEQGRATEMLSASPAAWGSLAYLTLFGSAIAFSSYLWLSRNVAPAQVSTYAVVNPIIAVWLGWLIAGERVGADTLVFSLIALTGTYLVVVQPKGRAKPSA